MTDFYSQSVTTYCERSGVDFYVEPINAISNVAFFISAFYVLQLYNKHQIKDKGYWLLSIFLILIGVGSSLWHTFRNPFTHAMDFLPIFAFFLTFLFLFLRKLLGNTKRAAILTVSFFVVQLIASFLFPDFLNGSIRHFINALAFIGLIYYIKHKSGYVSKDIFFALVLYALAIIFRSIDNSVCLYLPIGTHFLWHILGSAGAYFAVKALVGMRAN